MSSKQWSDYMELEGWRDYYCIEVFQYVTDDAKRTEVMREIDNARTKEECQSIIAKARGL